MKRITVILLCMAMILSGFSCVVAEPAPIHDYLPGLFEYRQELCSAVECVNAAYDGEFLNMEESSVVGYEFTLPFDAAKIDIKYAATDDVKLSMQTPNNDYVFALGKDAKEITYNLTIEHSGETYFTFKSDKPVKIREIKYTKKETKCQSAAPTDMGNAKGEFDTVVSYTPYQQAVNTAFVLMEESSGIKVRNLTRYIDLDDTSVTVEMINDRMYLPVETIARGFSLYYEDRPDEKYVYLSGDSFSIYQKDGKGYYEKAGSKSEISDFVQYVDGKSYLPLRGLGELLGLTVLYKDGIAVVDTKLAANNIINNDDVMAKLREELSAYIPSERGMIYHVAQSKNASDENDGTESAPFATIQKAADMAMAGDTVVIHGGVYREKVTVKNDGTAGNPIIFTAAEGEEVTVSAFEKATDFVPYTNPVNGVEMYKASLADFKFDCLIENGWDVDRNFVMYDGEILVEGRHPNEKTSAKSTVMRLNERLDKEKNPTQMEEFTREVATGLNPDYPDKDTHKLVPTYGDMRIVDMYLKNDQEVREGNYKIYNHPVESDIDLNQEQEDYWKGAIFVGAVGYNWQLSAAQVTSSKKGEAIVSEYWRGDSGSVTYNVNKYAHDYGYLTHHINTVDKPGEWYIDNKAKEMYIIPPTGVSGEELEVDVKDRMLVFDLNDRQYVQIHGINTRGGGLAMNNAKGCVINGGTHKYISQFDIAGQYKYSLTDMYARWDVLKGGPAVEGGLELPDTSSSGEGGFSISGHYNAITNTDIEYSAGAGIFVTGSYNLVENNKVDKTGYGVTYPCGVYVQGTSIPEGQPKGGHQIYQNTSTAGGRASFAIGQMTNGAPMDIAFNEFAWGCLNSRDTGVWYMYAFIGGDDLTKSQLHHNAVHDIAGSMDSSILTTLFYNDGYVGLYDVYDNIYYNSTDDPAFAARYTFKHSGLIGGFQDEWSNYTFNFPTADAVKFEVADYPGGYPMEYGARFDGDETFNVNYDRIRENEVINLANETLSDGAFVDKDGFVIFPDENASVVVDNIEIAEEGAKIYVYYASDKYDITVEKLPTVWMELFDGDKSLGTVSTQLFAHAAVTDKLSRGVIYVSKDYKDADTIKITTSNPEVRFATLSVVDFDYDAENQGRDVPFDAQILPFGSYDRLDENPATPYPCSVSSSLTEASAENLTYWGVGNTRNNGFYYKDVKIGKNCDEILFSGSSNATYSKSKLTVYIGTDATGEKIAEIDCSEEWPTGKAWHQRFIKRSLLKNIEPGTYDIYVKFDNTSDELGEFEMSFNGGALAFY